MKLSEYKGEEALDVLAELIEPAAEIMSDTEIVEMVRNKVPKIKIIKPMLKNHKKSIIEIMAILDGEDVEEYTGKVNLLTLPKKLLEILNDPEVMSLFTLQGQNTEETNFGSASESIEDDEQ